MSINSFINSSDILGSTINQSVLGLSGNIGLSLLIIFIFLLLVTVFFRVRLDYAVVFLLPFLIVCSAFVGSLFIPVLVGCVIYVAFIITKYMIFQ
jgi:hypothetical protein